MNHYLELKSKISLFCLKPHFADVRKEATGGGKEAIGGKWEERACGAARGTRRKRREKGKKANACGAARRTKRKRKGKKGKANACGAAKGTKRKKGKKGYT